jgi:hypothetical protein
MLLTMRLGIAASTALVAIGIGEVTSPLQNIWFILKNVRYKSQSADEVFRYLSWVYAAFYVFCRSICGPVVVRCPTASLCVGPGTCRRSAAFACGAPVPGKSTVLLDTPNTQRCADVLRRVDGMAHV